MNQQITDLDLFEFIGRQALQIDLLKRQAEQLQTMLVQSQNGIAEAQKVAKGLHRQIQKSTIENNGAEIKQPLEDYSTR